MVSPWKSYNGFFPTVESKLMTSVHKGIKNSSETEDTDPLGKNNQ